MDPPVHDCVSVEARSRVRHVRVRVPRGQLRAAQHPQRGARRGSMKMPSVSITRLRVRKWRYLPLFVVWAARSVRQAKRAPGNLGVGLLRYRRNAFWTKTVWEDDAAMRAFMLS